MPACQEAGRSPGGSRQTAVEFQVDIADEKSPGSAFKSLEGASALVVSIEDASGAVVYDSEQVALYGFEGNHLSHPLSLVPGSYALTEFLVIDAAGAVLYAAPVEGSAMAYLVGDPLTISFDLSTDAVTTVRPEVLSTTEHVPEDFGYTSFGLGDIEVIDTIDFLVSVFVYNASLQELEPTTAMIEVVNENGDALYAGSLDAVTSKITVQDGHAQYQVTVSKEGYESKSQSFTAAELAAFFAASAQGPLEVVLHACAGSCAAASCDDGIQNANEIDVDCGGHCGPGTCQSGQMCTVDSDCATGSCDAGVCSSNVALALGSYHTCALLDTGSIRCWGQNAHGQLGYGHADNIGDDEPASAGGDVPLDNIAVELVAGGYHTCALLDTGAVRCWGQNAYGQLGYGHTGNIGDDEPASAAGDVPLGGTAVQLVAGGYHTCALLDTGAIRCWGRNANGQLGYGHTSDIGDDEPASAAGDVPLGGSAIQLTAGWHHTCALLDTGAVRCWGLNSSGQLGYGHTSDIGDDEPASAAGDVPLGGSTIQVAVDGRHSCALLDTGAVRCWGMNSHGNLGHGHTNRVGDDEPASAAGDVSLGGSATQLAVGGWQNCVRLDTGAVRCWGQNTYGQLGYGHTDNIGDDEPASAGGDVPFLP